MYEILLKMQESILHYENIMEFLLKPDIKPMLTQLEIRAKETYSTYLIKLILEDQIK